MLTTVKVMVLFQLECGFCTNGNPFKSSSMISTDPSDVYKAGGTLTCTSFLTEVFGMFVRWTACHALHLCSWNGQELGHGLLKFDFLKCGNCVVQVNGCVNDDIAKD